MARQAQPGAFSAPVPDRPVAMRRAQNQVGTPVISRTELDHAGISF
jgi:hypothetical protein